MRTNGSRHIRSRRARRAQRLRDLGSPCRRAQSARKRARAGRMENLGEDVALAMAQARRGSSGSSKNAKTRKASGRTKTKSGVPAVRPGRPGATTTPNKDLSKLLSPKNLQESLKTVGTLRNFVKNGLNYLQQADRLLDTLYVTSNSLKESGVLEKIIKNRGRNLTTEDFTNILMALMNSPLGGQVLKGSGGGGDSNVNAAGTAEAKTPPQGPPPGGQQAGAPGPGGAPYPGAPPYPEAGHPGVPPY
ncbi:MAG: hypothetical protein K6T63_04935 [Alicyclobacillus herbarius]|uniref:hypothetical protein n=1 Tax=Alicyclobacillus herbarius TaxID=122960 RepID=UPI002353E591|nr:hypothetical protein [Alicyclobacillus herbarius]MCL6631960.1 hypothetical protein [Alicyclobacillus herbarius]